MATGEVVIPVEAIWEVGTSAVVTSVAAAILEAGTLAEAVLGVGISEVGTLEVLVAFNTRCIMVRHTSVARCRVLHRSDISPSRA